MSIVDKIQRISIDRDKDEGTLEKLEEALCEYHKLVEDGILIPRGNTLETNYTTCTLRSNVNI